MTPSTLLGGSAPSFVGMTIVLFGAAAAMTGQALARNWRPTVAALALRAPARRRRPVPALRARSGARASLRHGGYADRRFAAAGPSRAARLSPDPGRGRHRGRNIPGSTERAAAPSAGASGNRILSLDEDGAAPRSLAAAAAAEPDLLGESRALVGVVRRDHRIIRRQAPFVAILVGRETIAGARMALQRLELSCRPRGRPGSRD